MTKSMSQRSLRNSSSSKLRTRSTRRHIAVTNKDSPSHGFISPPTRLASQNDLAQIENATMSRYEYMPLPGANYIRLLKLDPRQDANSAITGSLSFRELDAEEPKFTTISYSWGRNSDGYAGLTHEILIDGYVLAITENLYDLLVQLSKPGSEKQVLWVDAICINQNHIDERSAQVSIMCVIYQRASSLIIWLGNGVDEAEDRTVAEALDLDPHGAQEDIFPTDGSNFEQSHSESRDVANMSRVQALAFDVAFVLAARYNPPIKETHRIKLEDNWANRLWPRLVRYAFVGSTGREAYRHLTAHPGARELLRYWAFGRHFWKAFGRGWLERLVQGLAESCEALLEFCGRRYFTRRWILQEIYHSRLDSTSIRWGSYASCPEELLQRHYHILALVGSLHFEYTDLSSARKKQNLRTLSQLSRQRTALDILEIQDLKEHWARDGTTSHMPSLLWYFRDTRCTDDRDLIYSLLGLAGHDKLPAADYSLSPEEAFTALASSMIAQGHLEYVLFAAATQYQYGHRARIDDQRDTSLPSWVPHLKCHFPYATQERFAGGIPDAQASVTDNGKELTVFVEVGRWTEGRYLCPVKRYKGYLDYLVLRPLVSEQDCYVLDGGDYCGRERPGPWQECSDVGKRLIRLR